MNNITINNHGTINIYDEDIVGTAKDKLLTKLFYARNKDTIGGRATWENLLNMYYMTDYEGMYEFIESCQGKGGKTRRECLGYLDIIMEGRGVKC